MTVLLFLFVLWLVGIWIFAIGVIALTVVLAALLAWRIAWAAGAFVIRFLAALLDGPERGAR